MQILVHLYIVLNYILCHHAVIKVFHTCNTTLKLYFKGSYKYVDTRFVKFKENCYITLH